MDELIDLIKQFIESEADAKACADSCAEDISYFCHREIAWSLDVQGRLELALNRYIDDRVKFVLNQAAVAQLAEDEPRVRPKRKPETETDGPKSNRRWDDAHLRRSRGV